MGGYDERTGAVLGDSHTAGVRVTSGKKAQFAAEDIARRRLGRGEALPNPPGRWAAQENASMNIDVRQDDLSSAEVQSLIAEHLSGMHSNSPPGHVHALAIENLRAPSVTFWTAWVDGILCGCGALKELDPHTGEVKSMRTRSAFLRRGVGQAVLDEIVRTAHRRGYSRLLLETGTGQAFEPAHALYRRNGFEWSSPFGEYAATDFNVFMAKALALGNDVPGRV